jgi:hypothetical protein
MEGWFADKREIGSDTHGTGTVISEGGPFDLEGWFGWGDDETGLWGEDFAGTVSRGHVDDGVDSWVGDAETVSFVRETVGVDEGGVRRVGRGV